MLKHFILPLLFTLAICQPLNAEVYHGIDLTELRKNADMSSEEKLKSYIDAILTIRRQRKVLSNCENTSFQEDITCYQTVAKDFFNTSSPYPQESFNSYLAFQKAVFEAYSLKYCQNKFIGAGHTCAYLADIDAANALKQFLSELLTHYEQEMLNSFIFLKDIKE